MKTYYLLEEKEESDGHYKYKEFVRLYHIRPDNVYKVSFKIWDYAKVKFIESDKTYKTLRNAKKRFDKFAQFIY